MSDDLAQLRDEVNRLDRELVEIAARRHAVVRRIARAKAASGGAAPLFDRAREADVLRRAAAEGSRAGLPAGTAERLLRTLIDASHDTQETLLAAPGRRRAEDDAARPRILVIGGAGQMGRLLLRLFGERGCATDAFDVPGAHETADTRARAIAGADIVILSVPMDRVVAVTREVAPHVREDALLCDINSLKVDVCAAMERGCRGEALGLHPMFGPTVHSLRRQKIVVCPIREGARAAWLRAELGRMGAELIDAEPDAHDRMMAVVQVLVHHWTLVMGCALRRSGVSIDESLQFTSPIYRLELSIVGRLFTQDPDLYAEILMKNPHAGDMRRHFAAGVEEVKRVVEGGDRDGFRRLFTETGAYFEGFAEEAMALSDAIIDELVGRA